MRPLVVLLGAVSLLGAQTFEAASVRRSGPNSGNDRQGGPGSGDPISFRYTSATLEDLIVVAYDVEYYQVSSRSPIDRDTFDVSAKVPRGATRQQFRTMLQSLLADRFSLTVHRETKEFAGYAMIVAKSGVKLKEGATLDSIPEGFPAIPAGKRGLRLIETPQNGSYLVRLNARQIPVGELVRAVHVPGDGPIVDETGLTAAYDFTLEYSYGGRTAQEPPEPAPAPSIFTALQAQLGLQLVSKRVPLEVIVIDRFNRAPSEN